MKLFTIVLGAALAFAGALSAQNVDDRVNVNFPNSVVVNGVTLPAGAATIQVLRTAGGVMLIVRSESGEHSAVLANRINNLGTEDTDASVILDRKDGVYRLNRVQLPDHTALQVLDAQ